jgi:hypothetical protein
MVAAKTPCLSLAIAPLTAARPGHWAIWVVEAPYPGGYVHHDCTWSEKLTQLWTTWQGFFTPHTSPNLGAITLPLPENLSKEEAGNYSTYLMQELGIQLWQWIFQGPIHPCFSQSRGIALGQTSPLRLRVELRDPDLVALPWEIAQPQMGKQAIALSQTVLFSRTISDVDALTRPRLGQSLNVLLVLGQADHPETSSLQLQQEAETLKHYLTTVSQVLNPLTQQAAVSRRVDLLIQPRRSDLIKQLEQGRYNLFFYAGHGLTAPAGGQLLLNGEESLSGTELAQILVRCQVTLAVFNACWGAQLDRVLNPTTGHPETLLRSSLAETLIHHGVPAVLGMRDEIADEEALNFIQKFVQALSCHSPIDEAVAIARQHLLTLYRFNHPAWTLPVLYMHPHFDGQLIQPLEEQTELPTNISPLDSRDFPAAQVRSLEDPTKTWPIRDGLMRVGRRVGNDLVLAEQWVSQNHAKILCRNRGISGSPTYFLQDFSRFGTLITQRGSWYRVHHQEVPLTSGTQLRFGSPQGPTLEFVIVSKD